MDLSHRSDRAAGALRRSARQSASRPAARSPRGLLRRADHIGLRSDPARSQLRHRLAEVDRLRDEALRRGDVEMLAEADRRERVLRREAARHAEPRHGEAPQRPELGTSEEETPFYGPGHGRLTAEEARRDGRQFGQRVAEHSREGLAWPEPQPALDPATGEPLPWGPGYGRLTSPNREELNDARRREDGRARRPATENEAEGGGG